MQPPEYNKIPVHDDNKEFKGSWKLVFDVNGEEKEFISNQTSEYIFEIQKKYSNPPIVIGGLNSNRKTNATNRFIFKQTLQSINYKRCYFVIS